MIEQEEMVAMVEEQSSTEDIDIFYKAFSKYKPELEESNAESVERSRLIDEEIQRLQELKRQLNKTKKTEDDGYTTPDNQIKKNKLQNNVQNVDITEDYLYPNPDKPRASEPIEVIMDTGAAMTMFPDTYPYAWHKLRPCLYSISGCFKGEKHSDLQIGEFHGVMTLDSGEVIRVIVPEAVQLPTQISHSCLLANTPFLLAGHQYINDLYTPKLKLKNAGTYTMSVVKGHHILKILPTDALTETTHRKIYLHNDHPYDPPTFMNNVIYQAVNRPNAHTPTAFIYHLRFGCKSIQVLQHTQRHVEGIQVQITRIMAYLERATPMLCLYRRKDA